MKKMIEEIGNFPNLYDSMFKMRLIHKEESILIIGDSGYKTFLA